MAAIITIAAQSLWNEIPKKMATRVFKFYILLKPVAKIIPKDMLPLHLPTHYENRFCWFL